MNRVCIGIDFGGTFIKFNWVDASGQTPRTGKTFSLPTPKGGEAVADQMVVGARKVMEDPELQGAEVLAVGVGSPGPLDREQGVILEAPNVPGMTNFPLRDRIAEALSLPTALENDANAAAYGEYLCGAGADANEMVLLTLGTGLGSGVVRDGKILHGAHGIGAELGHMIVQPGGRPCPCGQQGCLEQYASAYNLAKYATQRIEDEKLAGPLAEVLESTGKLEAHDIHSTVVDRDPLAMEIWDQCIEILALGCVNIARIFDPDRIVLAGGMTAAGQDLLEPLQKHYEKNHWTMTPIRTTLAIADLGADAGAIGAAGIAWRDFAS